MSVIAPVGGAPPPATGLAGFGPGMIGNVFWRNGPEILAQPTKRAVSANAEHDEPSGSIVVEVFSAMCKARALEHFCGGRDGVAKKLRELTRAKPAEAFADVRDGVLCGAENLVAEFEIFGCWSLGNSCRHQHANLVTQLPNIEVFYLLGSHSEPQECTPHARLTFNGSRSSLSPSTTRGSHEGSSRGFFIAVPHDGSHGGSPDSFPGVLHTGSPRGSSHSFPPGFFTLVPPGFFTPSFPGVLHTRSPRGSSHSVPPGFSTLVPPGVLHTRSPRFFTLPFPRGSPHSFPLGFSTLVPLKVLRHGPPVLVILDTRSGGVSTARHPGSHGSSRRLAVVVQVLCARVRKRRLTTMAPLVRCPERSCRRSPH